MIGLNLLNQTTHSQPRPTFRVTLALSFFTTLTMKTGLLLLTVSLLVSNQVQAQANVQKFPIIPLNAGMYVIKAEFAATPEQRAQGLMYREKMGSNEGMIFDFGAAAQVCMWMKNTLIPLSVAFLDDDGKIVNIEDMQPQTLDSHCGKKPVRYALEMNLGWFKQKHILPGSKITGLPK